MVRTRRALALLALAFVSCSGSVTFRSTFSHVLDVTGYSSNYVPWFTTGMSYKDGIACPPADCQTLVPSNPGEPGSDVVMTCNENHVCDPEPYPFVVDVGVQDLSELANAHVSVLDRVQLTSVELTIDSNTCNTALPAFDVRWGPESSSSATLTATTHLLATTEALAAGQTGRSDVTLVPEQLDALDAYVRGTSPRVRFFLVSTIDAEPGQTIPTGALGATIGLIIRASGDVR